MSSQKVKVFCRRERESVSGEAVLVCQDDDETWLPLSEVESMHFDEAGHGHLVIPLWLADDRELVYEILR